MVALSQRQLADPVELTRALVDIESVSGDEKEIADAVEAALTPVPHLRVARSGNVVHARTELGRPGRVMLAGHLDTVPLHDNFPSRQDGDLMYGCGTSDMKSGTAIALHLAATVTEPVHDLSFLFYDCEEVESERNGLHIVSRTHPEWLAADVAFLLEPTYGEVEAGCQGTMRAEVRASGTRAHSARSWLGDNAIHHAGEILRRLSEYPARRVTIDGCHYREGMNAVGVRGGVAGNVIPDECVVEVNFRFAPDRSPEQAAAHVRELFAGFDVTVTDSAAGALPGLAAPVVAGFLAAVGRPPVAKLGWTDVARFASLGIPALNFGPGDPNLAHTRDEHVECARITACADTLRSYLTGE
ncbi:succinyldiaminopimelate desuccinylase [Stackebrandtia albiflava]|uniref:Succinyl-diaminopimelate desuccinylase n=1 Tax=Stackebrandtia albiflava TaxID=406432 RepID=A0A562UPT7_9ACTN|nr:succinyl-diaminopimelate desuccinylase [Stackebrandtia albiflava]TWJ07629.1 succinyldiaminopimelate desuccinylase [Stackebrandtia albiflava]